MKNDTDAGVAANRGMNTTRYSPPGLATHKDTVPVVAAKHQVRGEPQLLRQAGNTLQAWICCQSTGLDTRNGHARCCRVPLRADPPGWSDI